MRNFQIHPVRRILVPTDFSANAFNATQYAVEMAMKMDSRIILYHATHVPVLSSNEMVALSSNDEMERESLIHLDQVRLDIQSKTGFNDIEKLTSSGFAVDEITTLVGEQKIDLVVMGTRGASGLGEMLIGSNTADVIERCKCPVLAVPAEAKYKMPTRVIFATNYADNDFQSLYLLAEMLKPYYPEIVVLHVEEQEESKVEERMLEWFKAQVLTSIPYDKFSFHLMSSRHITAAINEFIELNGVDMLAVSTRKRNFFDKLTSRSLTKKLAYHTHIPLLAFHAHSAGGTPLF